MRKLVCILLVIAFLNSYIQPLYAYTMIAEYLCEIGLKFYRQGNIPEALHEFNKALIAHPGYAPAREYIRLIQEELARREGIEIEEAVKLAPVTKPKAKPVAKVLPKPTVPPAPKAMPKVGPAPAPAPVPIVTPPAPAVVTPPAPVVTPPPVVIPPAPVVTVPAPVIAPPAPVVQPQPVVVAPPAPVVVQPPPAPVVTAPPPVVAKPAVPLEKEKEAAMEKAMRDLERISIPPAALAKAPALAPAVVKEEVAPKKITAPPPVLVLDESVKALTGAIEIEQGKSIVIQGENIQRYLLTAPGVLDIQKQSANELLATAKDFGYTYMHIWDDAGRWTVEFLTVPVKPEGPTFEEVMRRAEERANTFKLRYSLDWSSFETGRRINSMERTSYSYGHYLTLTGPTPYGDIDSSASIRTLKENTDLTYFTAGLTNGRIGPFEGFTLRGADFSPPITNLELSSPTLRGVMLKSPAFHKKVDYTIFWGREGGGRYGSLSPGLSKTKHSFLSGTAFNYYLNKNQTYGFSVFRGWGRDRSANLREYGYDAYADYRLKDWDMRYEIAHDSDNLAHLFTATYEKPKLQFTTEIRNTDKDFVTMTGTGWRVGELGTLFTLAYTPIKDLDIMSRLDVFQDRLYPNPEAAERWNEDFMTDVSWRLDELTSLRADYNFQNELGRISPYRAHNMGLGWYHTFEWPRRVTSYINLRRQENKHYTSQNLDYINNKVTGGLRFNLFKDLYYFVSQEYNWLNERYTGSKINPQAFETGVDWSHQIGRTPFYSSWRVLYRDEQDTDSALSFLSGEDYLEGYGTLSYRPAPDKEWYCSTRMRNVWAESPDTVKRVEADFNVGFRYMWDTGMRWEPIGAIDGYVFKDMNSDGLRQGGEEAVEGVRLWLGKRSTESNSAGYYKFDKIRARRAYVNLDTQTLPSGFVLTVPVTQEALIANHKSVKLDFGVICRSEIWGLVFLDVDGDNRFSADVGDKGIKGVILTLENGLKAITDGNGQYRFPQVSAEEHTITLDLNTLPVEYLPTVPLRKTAVVFEGVSYNYNIPVKSSK